MERPAFSTALKLFFAALAALVTCTAEFAFSVEPDDTTWGEYQLREDEGPDVLVAPGAETAEVISFLQRIIDGSVAQQARLQNVRVTGRVSWVSRKTSPSNRLKVDPRQMTPDWHDFLFVQQGTKRRFEQDYVYNRTGGRETGRIYRLINGTAFYRVQVNGLDIEKLPSGDNTWPMETYDFSFYAMVDNGRIFVSAVDASKFYIDQLTGNYDREYFKRTNRFLRCYEKDGLMVVENVHGPKTEEAKLGYRYSFTIDPEKGYNVVEARRQLGGPGKSLFSTSETRSTCNEIAPGVFFVSTAQCVFGNFGVPKNRNRSTGWGRRDVEVAKVEFGDFQCDPAVFDPNLLPIPLAFPVTDYRTEPETNFKFGERTLDEQIKEPTELDVPMLK